MTSIARRRHRMVFLGNLEEQSIREACIGAAEFAAERKDVDFEPWPLESRGTRRLTSRDFAQADSLLLTGRAYDVVFGGRHRVALPHVFFLGAAPPNSAASVEIDERQIGKMAAEHLLGRGYRHLAGIIPSELSWAELRATGFCAECRQSGTAAQVFRLPVEVLPIYWRAKMAKRREQLGQILAALPKPCGIFAANDVIACFIIETARAGGLRVPSDIGVVGVDDDPVPNAAAGMAISSVQLPFRELGRQAARLLQLRFERPGSRVVVSLAPVRVLVRASTDAFMIDDPLVRKAQAQIEQNRHRPIRVAEVVTLLNTTAMTLGKHFQRHLRLKPSQYILLRRIAYAQEQLRAGQLNVAAVSDLCGFHNCSYFCKVFKQITGQSPGSLRRFHPLFTK